MPRPVFFALANLTYHNSSTFYGLVTHFVTHMRRGESVFLQTLMKELWELMVSLAQAKSKSRHMPISCSRSRKRLLKYVNAKNLYWSSNSFGQQKAARRLTLSKVMLWRQA